MRLTPDGEPERGHRDLVVLALLLIVAGVLASLSPDQSAAVTSQLRSTVLAPFLEAHRSLQDQARLTRQLVALREDRDSLARQLVRARSRAMESGQLRALLGAPAPAEGTVLPAEIRPGRVRQGLHRTFALRIGTPPGDGDAPPRIEAPAGVFTADGVVGIVRWTSGRRAEGDFWTHPDFRVSVRTEAGEASGIVRPTYESEQPVMLLEGAPYQTAIPAGTTLYTSGLGGVFPPWIPVGTVKSVSGVESGWEKSYRVEAAVRPEQVGTAFIWGRPSGPTEAPAGPASGEPTEAPTDSAEVPTGPSEASADPADTQPGSQRP